MPLVVQEPLKFYADGINLTVKQGETLTRTIALYKDSNLSEAADLTDCTVVLSVTPFLATAPTTYQAAPQVVAQLSPALVTFSVPTSGFEVGPGRWALEVTDGQGTVSYPSGGNLFVGT